jgi:multidrug efflux pump subunit AcrA (membrane-fusion protein)
MKMDQYPAKSGYEEILEKKKLEFKTVVSELISTFRSKAELGQFLQVLLAASIRLMEGVGGSIWVRRGNQMGLAFEAGESRGFLPKLEGDGSEESILKQISQVMQPYVAPLIQKDEDKEDQRGHIGIYIPIDTGDELFGILKVVKQSESKVIYREDIEFLQNIGGLVSIYLSQLQLPKVLSRMEEIGKLFDVHKEVFSSLDPTKIAFTLANLLPEVVHCERCTVGLYDRKRLRIKAITGQDLIEQKSVTIRSLTRILEEAAKTNDSVNLTHENLEGMEEGMLKEAGEEYFQEHPFKVLHAVPIHDKDQNFGVISVEMTKEEGFSQTDLTFLRFVSAQAALALKNARLFQGIPLARTWQRLLKVSEKVSVISWSRRILYILAALAIILTPLLVPVENKVGGKCEIFPINRYYARAKTEGILKTFLIQEGNRVEKGNIVAMLDDEPFQKRLREALTRKDVLQANVVKYFGLGQMADYEIERLKLKEVEAEIEFLQSELEKTKIVAEGPGIVITPQPRFWERIGKPVTKGEELLEIGELDRLRMEVAVDEKDIKFVQVGQKILFLLNSLPDKSFEIKAKVIREKAEVRETGNFFIIEADLDSLEGPFKPGMKGEAKIYAGKAPLGEVYLREMIEWFRMKIFKFF